MVVLDTDCLSLLDRGGAETDRLRGRLAVLPRDEVATTIITYEEQMRGWMVYLSRARTVGAEVEAYGKLRSHVESYRKIQVIDFDAAAAVEFQRLRKAKIRVGSMDLKIAAVVLSLDAILLSRNLSDFSRIPGLRVEDWTI
jgi:tRNA(fMet)-specific endonuclease VapC